MVAWRPFCVWMGWMKTPEPVQQTQQQQTPAETPLKITEVPEKPAAGAEIKPEDTTIKYVSGRKIEVPLTMNELPLQHLSNDNFDMAIHPAYGEIRNITFEKYFQSDRTSKLVANGLYEDNIGMLGVYSDVTWRVLEILENKLDGDTYTLSRRIATEQNQFIVVQTWKIAYDYGVDYTVQLKNTNTPLAFSSLAISGGVLKPFAIMGGDRIRNDDYLMYFRMTNGKERNVKLSAKDEKFFVRPEAPVQWVGLGTKYFMNVLVADTPFTDMVQMRAHKAATAEQAKVLGDKTYYISDVNGVYNQFKLAADQEHSMKFKFYFGPKDQDMVNAFEPTATYISKLMSLRPMNALATFMLWSLAKLKAFCGSYGWAIILLTAIVRILLWPITHKANMSMKRMQAFKPEMDEIRKKHKDNPQLMQVKMGELYKREGLHPMRGCLPLLLQLPIFMSLYFALDGAMELRHVAFWWASDLSQPDTVIRIFSFPLNPLVLVMTGLMLLQQKLMPQAGDPTQQKVMMFMPLIMLVFLYSLPSGLTLYWTVSQIFSILQMLLTQKLAGQSTPQVPKAAKA